MFPKHTHFDIIFNSTILTNLDIKNQVLIFRTLGAGLFFLNMITAYMSIICYSKEGQKRFGKYMHHSYCTSCSLQPGTLQVCFLFTKSIIISWFLYLSFKGLGFLTVVILFIKSRSDYFAVVFQSKMTSGLSKYQ